LLAVVCNDNRAAGSEQGTERRQAGAFLDERHLMQDQAGGDLGRRPAPEQAIELAQVTPLEPRSHARAAELAAGAREDAFVRVDADERRPGCSLPDAYKEAAGAAARIHDHVVVAGLEPSQRCSTPDALAR